MLLLQLLSLLLLLTARLTLSNAFSSQQPERANLNTNIQPSRRQMLFQGLISPFIASLASIPSPAFAVGEGTERMIFKQKPTAPIEALLPSIQQRLLLEVALDLMKKSEGKTTIDADSSKKLKVILPILDDTPNFNNQNGSQNSRVLKQHPPDDALRGDVIRAAMNVYQLNLNYDALLNMSPGDAVSVTDPDWKKSYIRKNDGLPDLERIVGADIDMRQLLRNQVQLDIDDASAELWAVECDTNELTSLLQDAAGNFDLWLDRVRAGDVRDALEVVQGTQKDK